MAEHSFFASIRHRWNSPHGVIPRFLLVGVLNTAFGYGVFALFIALGFANALAILVANIAGVLFNFVTYGKVAFQVLDWRRAPLFALVYAVSYTVNVWTLDSLSAGGLSPYLAQLAILPFLLAFSYLALRYFVFRPEK